MAGHGKCAQAGCHQSRHMGKAYCLAHYKEQDQYTYGLDADIKSRMAAKFDPSRANEAQHWIESLSGMRCPAGTTLQEYLKNGRALCMALNKIKPGTVRVINPASPSMPFKEMENVNAYLEGCRGLGCKPSDLFMTRDLYENANMLSVVDNIHQLGALSRKVAGFGGPHIGVKLAEENKRAFTEEQLKRSEPSRQTQGDYGYQDESKVRSIDRQIIKDVAGVKPVAGGATRQTQGSYGYQVEPDKGLDKIIRTPGVASSAHAAAARPAASAPAPAAAAAAPAAAGAAGAARFCATCGTARAAGALFCAKCGKKF
jgi:hypothetical protein